MGRWSSEQTLKFAELYQGHECLWNPAYPEYRNKHMRVLAIKDIINQMGIADFKVEDVRKKIKSLRSTYFLEVHKIKQSAMFVSDSQGLYEPPMEWFSVIDCIMQSTKGYTKRSEEPYYAEEVFPEELVDSSIPDQSLNDDSLGLEKLKETQSCASVENCKDLPANNTRGKGRRRKFALKQATGRRKNTQQSVCCSNPETSMSENEAFGRYIAKSLNKLSSISSILAQQEIQSVLTRFRLKETSGVGDAAEQIVVPCNTLVAVEGQSLL